MIPSRFADLSVPKFVRWLIYVAILVGAGLDTNGAERVANFLCEISALYEARRVSVKPLTLHITRDQIGEYLGLSIEAVSRSFSALKKSNVIALPERDAVVILEREQLGEIGKFTSGADRGGPMGSVTL